MTMFFGVIVVDTLREQTMENPLIVGILILLGIMVPVLLALYLRVRDMEKAVFHDIYQGVDFDTVRVNRIDELEKKIRSIKAPRTGW